MAFALTGSVCATTRDSGPALARWRFPPSPWSRAPFSHLVPWDQAAKTQSHYGPQTSMQRVATVDTRHLECKAERDHKGSGPEQRLPPDDPQRTEPVSKVQESKGAMSPAPPSPAAAAAPSRTHKYRSFTQRGPAKPPPLPSPVPGHANPLETVAPRPGPEASDPSSKDAFPEVRPPGSAGQSRRQRNRRKALWRPRFAADTGPPTPQASRPSSVSCDRPIRGAGDIDTKCLHSAARCTCHIPQWPMTHMSRLVPDHGRVVVIHAAHEGLQAQVDKLTRYVKNQSVSPAAIVEADLPKLVLADWSLQSCQTYEALQRWIRGFAAPYVPRLSDGQIERLIEAVLPGFTAVRCLRMFLCIVCVALLLVLLFLMSLGVVGDASSQTPPVLEPNDILWSVPSLHTTVRGPLEAKPTLWAKLVAIYARFSLPLTLLAVLRPSMASVERNSVKLLIVLSAFFLVSQGFRGWVIATWCFVISRLVFARWPSIFVEGERLKCLVGPWQRPLDGTSLLVQARLEKALDDENLLNTWLYKQLASTAFPNLLILTQVTPASFRWSAAQKALRILVSDERPDQPVSLMHEALTNPMHYDMVLRCDPEDADFLAKAHRQLDSLLHLKPRGKTTESLLPEPVDPSAPLAPVTPVPPAAPVAQRTRTAIPVRAPIPVLGQFLSVLMGLFSQDVADSIFLQVVAKFGSISNKQAIQCWQLFENLLVIVGVHDIPEVKEVMEAVRELLNSTIANTASKEAPQVAPGPKEASTSPESSRRSHGPVPKLSTKPALPPVAVAIPAPAAVSVASTTQATRPPVPMSVQVLVPLPVPVPMALPVAAAPASPTSPGSQSQPRSQSQSPVPEQVPVATPEAVVAAPRVAPAVQPSAVPAPLCCAAHAGPGQSEVATAVPPARTRDPRVRDQVVSAVASATPVPTAVPGVETPQSTV